MKSEDTILGTTQDAVWDFELFKQQQAEVSFTAGIKMVTDWINKEGSTVHKCDNRILIDLDGWKDKLKEWGIK